jgi:hypothetical protein
MRKLPAVAMIVLSALAVGSASPLLLHAQAAGGGGARGVAAVNNEDMPHRTARSFAPFVRAILVRRLTVAQQIFKLRRNVMVDLESAEVAQMFNRFNRPDRVDLNLVGGRNLGQNLGILFFTLTSQEGPVAFKVYYYGFGEDIYIARMDITDSWEDIETWAQGVENLPSPVTVPLGPLNPAGG